ncbi:MAG: methylmalonyl-CoA mutase family protein, partial [Deltaproteobacteria bacterium]|nr:methylmalonyl-CoA mutase family protein [Deltaproteobacteria bacterium]
MEVEVYKPKNNIRIVTATSLFDGHDASINIMRRILQNTGAEVIHLGHNRSVEEFVDAAIEEDVQGMALSSYQGGHMEFFKYMVDMLKEKGASHIKIFGGGGGVIVPDEIKELEEYGVTKIYSPEDGAKMGLQGIINHMIEAMDYSTVEDDNIDISNLSTENKPLIAKLITAVVQAQAQAQADGNGQLKKLKTALSKHPGGHKTAVIGITGTGGAGKSSLTDELVQRILHDFKNIKIAIISSDPSRRKTGGALLGDRIRMNSIETPRVYMRSLATRGSRSEVAGALPEAIEVAKSAGFDLVIAETAGIGQGDSRISEMVDLSIYVMTSEFGAPSQLEKIDMLDYADLVVVNKFEKRGSIDAMRDVRKQVQRNMEAWGKQLEDMPVFGTIASKFNDDGVTAMYYAVLEFFEKKTGIKLRSKLPRPDKKISSSKTIIIPSERSRYLTEISDTVRNYHEHTEEQSNAVRKAWHLRETLNTLEESGKDDDDANLLSRLKEELSAAEKHLDKETENLLDEWETIKDAYSKDELVYTVRNREIRIPLYTESLSHLKIPKIVLPGFKDPGEIYGWMRRENLPGYFPYTAGVFPMKRVGEDPTRMFAGEGDPFKTNARFRLLSANYEAKRLSTAFDSVTLYGYN